MVVLLEEENSPHVRETTAAAAVPTLVEGKRRRERELGGNDDAFGMTLTIYAFKKKKKLPLGRSSSVVVTGGGDVGSDNDEGRKEDRYEHRRRLGEPLQLGNTSTGTYFTITAAHAASASDATLPDHFAYPWVWGLRAAGSYGGNEDAELLAELPLGREPQPLAEEAVLTVLDSNHILEGTWHAKGSGSVSGSDDSKNNIRVVGWRWRRHSLRHTTLLSTNLEG